MEDSDLEEQACLPLMGRGDFSRPHLGRLKPPLPETKAPKRFHYFCEAHYLYAFKRGIRTTGIRGYRKKRALTPSGFIAAFTHSTVER